MNLKVLSSQHKQNTKVIDFRLTFGIEAKLFSSICQYGILSSQCELYNHKNYW